MLINFVDFFVMPLGWGHPHPDRHSDPAQILIQIQTQTHIQIQLLVGCGDVSQLAPALALPSETQHQHCVWTCVRHSRATKMFMRVPGSGPPPGGLKNCKKKKQEIRENTDKFEKYEEILKNTENIEKY